MVWIPRFSQSQQKSQNRKKVEMGLKRKTKPSQKRFNRRRILKTSGGLGFRGRGGGFYAREDW